MILFLYSYNYIMINSLLVFFVWKTFEIYNMIVWLPKKNLKKIILQFPLAIF